MAFHRLTIVYFSLAACLFLAIVTLYRPERPSVTYEQVSGDVPNTYPRNMMNLALREGTLPNSTAAMYRRLVVFTAFSSNHFKEALDMIGSVQKYLPYTKIIIYDIGLTDKERAEVGKYCNVELRIFDFQKYPPHVKNLVNFSWRPFMLEELAQEYDVILYGDASLRMIGYNISKALRSLLDFPFLDVEPGIKPIIALTHQDQIDYLNFPPSRKDMAEWKTVQATAWFLLVNDITREKIIAPWVDCVAHEECVAPKKASRSNCNFNILERKDGSYVGCHRFIQSALNIILVREFGLGIWNKVVRRNVMHPIATVYRHPQGIYSVKSHPYCNYII